MKPLQKSCTRKPSAHHWNRESRGFRAAVLGSSAALLVLLLVLGICIGSVPIPLGETIKSLTGGGQDSTFYQIIHFVRLPRVLAGALSGAALAVSGAVLQAVLNNSLAGPNIIGVNAGSGMFTILLASLCPGMLRFTPVAAFLGALFAVLLVYGIASRTGASRMTIVLAGVAVSSFFSAVTDTVLTLFPDTQANRFSFLIGGFSGVTMDNLGFAAPYILIGLLLSLLLSSDLNVLALGDETARSLGMRTGLIRMALLVLAALLAGGAVSFSGLLGFVGLIVPHAARFAAGHDNRFLLPLSALLGASFTLVCDLLARVLFAPFELPVGIVMSFLGAPFFLYLLLRQKRGLLE